MACAYLHTVSTSSFLLMPGQQNTFQVRLHASTPGLNIALHLNHSCVQYEGLISTMVQYITSQRSPGRHPRKCQNIQLWNTNQIAEKTPERQFEGSHFVDFSQTKASMTRMSVITPWVSQSFRPSPSWIAVTSWHYSLLTSLAHNNVCR
jgi:hypothetical protein